MAKERMVTRRVIESKTYDVYKVDGTQLVLIDTIEEKGKISEKELAKTYGVEKVVLVFKEEKKAVYGVPVSVFMEHAVKIEDTDTEQENN